MRNRSIRGLYVLAASVAVSSAARAGRRNGRLCQQPRQAAATTVCDNNPAYPALHEHLQPDAEPGQRPGLHPERHRKGVGAAVAVPEPQGQPAAGQQHPDQRGLHHPSWSASSASCAAPAASTRSTRPRTRASTTRRPTRCSRASSRPNGNESGFCVGAISRPWASRFALSAVAPRGPSGSPTWPLPSSVTLPGIKPRLLYFPLEFAADTSASNPLVLTLNPNSTNPQRPAHPAAGELLRRPRARPADVHPDLPGWHHHPQLIG